MPEKFKDKSQLPLAAHGNREALNKKYENRKSQRQGDGESIFPATFRSLHKVYTKYGPNGTTSRKILVHF